MRGPIRVLLTDDDPHIRALLRAQLESDDRFIVIGEAENGSVAVGMASELRPDAIVLDLAMPVMDGLEALPLLRLIDPKVKLAVLSGFGGRLLEDQARSLGADIYLEKVSSISSLGDDLFGICDVPRGTRSPSVVREASRTV
jgi:DNA-binding NarL/FixJ family response regulator